MAREDVWVSPSALALVLGARPCMQRCALHRGKMGCLQLWQDRPCGFLVPTLAPLYRASGPGTPVSPPPLGKATVLFPVT